MKLISILLGGLLIAYLGCVQAQAAIVSAKPKPRSAKVAKRFAVPARAPVPASVAPQGLALALSVSLRDLPAAPESPPPARVSQARAAMPAMVAPISYAPYQARSYVPGGDNPYLAKPAIAPAQVFAPIQVVPEVKDTEPGSLFGALSQAIPILPGSGQSILPSIKKVYPTGEKPLVVVSFKCPTEVLGVTPPTIKLLHNLVDLGMEGINKTDLLSFNLQQVCQ